MQSWSMRRDQRLPVSGRSRDEGTGTRRPQSPSPFCLYGQRGSRIGFTFLSWLATWVARARPFPGERAVPPAAGADAVPSPCRTGDVDESLASGGAARCAGCRRAAGPRCGRRGGVAKRNGGRQLVAGILGPRREGASRTLPRIRGAGASLTADLAWAAQRVAVEIGCRNARARGRGTGEQAPRPAGRAGGRGAQGT